jgi:hypothetical protein
MENAEKAIAAKAGKILAREAPRLIALGQHRGIEYGWTTQHPLGPLVMRQIYAFTRDGTVTISFSHLRADVQYRSVYERLRDSIRLEPI